MVLRAKTFSENEDSVESVSCSKPGGSEIHKRAFNKVHKNG